jgi:phage terminase large subunit GpA-like protein
MNPAKRMSGTDYKSVADIISSLSGLFRPPERLSISDAAEEYVRLNHPVYSGPYQNSQAPYMVEPMNCLQARLLSSVVFVGPAQSGKTESLVLNWMAYGIRVDPMDMLIYNPTQANARDFSKRRIDRMHRHSPEIGAQLVQRRDADNTFDKHYISGMMVTLSWPTVSEMSGKPVPRIALTDYDRMVEDVEGDGSPFDLASKRNTTFESFAMVMAESSPSREVTNPKYIPQSPNEAPPTTGILALYNRGDMRRWNWPCPACEEHFEGMWEHLIWDKLETNLKSARTVRMVCPHCGEKIHHNAKHKMNLSGVWLKEGQTVDRLGFVSGEGKESEIASFWLRGVAAAFITWQKLVLTYLDALDAFEKTGDHEALKKFYNTDLGEPYIPKGDGDDRDPLTLMNRREPLVRKTVPENTRFLLGTVDVQKRSFMTSVFAVLPGNPFDLMLIDREPIWLSDRLHEETNDPLPVRPGIYLEDWDLIEKRMLDKTYLLSDGSGRKMPLKLVVCDSGGEAGVTGHAYNFYRKLREDQKSHRFLLVKGSSTPGIPRVAIHFPDSQQKSKFAVAKGDVPVLVMNSNQIKDMADNRLSCLEPGKGMLRFAEFLPEETFSELCVESRTSKGWENKSNARNETWDLLCYAVAACLSTYINIDKIDWENPPLWAASWDKNIMILKPDQEEQFTFRPKVDYDFGALGRQLG